jgi:hypothetical protein
VGEHRATGIHVVWGPWARQDCVAVGALDLALAVSEEEALAAVVNVRHPGEVGTGVKLLALPLAGVFIADVVNLCQDGAWGGK